VNLPPLSGLLPTGRPADLSLALVAGTPMGFGRFAGDVAAAAERLRAGNSRRAALLCQDSYRFAVGLFALMHAGVTAVMLPNGQPGTLEALADTFDLLIDDAFLTGAPAAPSALAPLDPTVPALEFFTSGSTGVPKRIIKTLGMLEREVTTLDALWGVEMGRGPVFATVSHQHVYGLIFKLLWPLSSGRPFAGEMHEVWETLLDPLPPDAVIISSPSHLSRLSGIAPLPAGRRPRGIFSAGAPLSLAAARETADILGALPTEIFGSTETGAIATRRQRSDNQPWQPLPGITIATDANGRLRLQSPFLEGTDWFEAADLIEQSIDGFHLRGRTDRVAKIEGKRVSLADIESRLAGSPWVAASAVAVIPGATARLGAVVVPSAAGREMLARIGTFRFSRALRQALAETQEPAALPRLWRFRDALPDGAMGKSRDADILALFGAAP
jgi:acyl-coenzyme A synthetase/AMP-(fatty) acid ligase